MVVIGVGAIVEPTPPTSCVNHCTVFPGETVAVNGDAVAFKQYNVGFTTTAVSVFPCFVIVTVLSQ